MQQVVEQLESIVNEYSVKFLNLSEEALSFKPAADKWSKKEIIGHLIDSAQNNIRRFITAQYQLNPHVVYEQDIWVSIQHYKDYDKAALISLWQLLNEHIIFVLKNMPVEKYQQQCNTGKEKEELHTLEFLATDYITHHLHHLKQIV
jgi:DinB superfamily